MVESQAFSVKLSQQSTLTVVENGNLDGNLNGTLSGNLDGTWMGTWMGTWIGPNGAKWDQMKSNWTKLAQMGPNGTKWDQM